MNTEQSYRLLRISHKLYRMASIVGDTDKLPKSITCYKEMLESIARDTYDIVEECTTDETLKYQMKQARLMRSERYYALAYLNHRLNIGF